MRRLFFGGVSLLIYGFSLSTCSTQQSEFKTLPPALSESGKINFIGNFNKGKALYKICCGKCHNNIVNGKIVVPNFKESQLTTTLRISNKEHLSEISERDVSFSEMQMIFFYLSNKK